MRINRLALASTFLVGIAACGDTDLALPSQPDAAPAAPGDLGAAGDPVVDEHGRTHYLIDLHEAALAGRPRARPLVDRFAAYHPGEVMHLVRALEQEHGIVATTVTSQVALSFSAYLRPDDVARLEADPRVAALHPDVHLELSAGPVWIDTQQLGETVSWGTTAVNANGGAPSMVRVYVVDTGILASSDLNVVQRVNPLRPDNPNPVACYRHAQHVASIVGARTGGNSSTRGVAPGVALVSVGVYDPGPPGTGGCAPQEVTMAGLQAALDWVRQDIASRNQVGIVNVSINSPEFAAGGVLNERVRSLASTGKGGYPGALVVQSAGNGFTNACGHAFAPAAAADGVLVVGAINAHGQAVRPLNGIGGFRSGGLTQIERGSNFGACVEAWAPGRSIYGQFGSPSYAYLSGTSMSAPHVAGLAAMVAQSGLTGPQLETAVRTNLAALGSTAQGGAAITMPTLSPLAPGVPRSSPYGELFAGDQAPQHDSVANSSYIVYDDVGKIYLDSSGAGSCLLRRRLLPNGSPINITTQAQGQFSITGWPLGTHRVYADDCPPADASVTVRAAPRPVWIVNGVAQSDGSNHNLPSTATLSYSAPNAATCTVHISWYRDFVWQPHPTSPREGLPPSGNVGLFAEPTNYRYALDCRDAHGATRTSRVNIQIQPVSSAELVSQIVPTQVSPGQSFPVSLTFRNTGTSVWWEHLGYRLGSQNPRDNIRWGRHRVDLPPGEMVQAGATHTFSFVATAPTTPGTYGFQWQMVQESVQWFGALSPNVNIVVGGSTCGPSPACAPGETRSAACGNCGTRVDTCSATCQWQAGTCGGQGECAPNDARSCCPCAGGNCSCAGFQSCSNSCSWGPCAGYACAPNQCP